MKLENQICKKCGFETDNKKSFSNHTRNGCNFGRDYASEAYIRNKEKILLKNSRYRLNVKTQIYSLLGNVCSECGFSNKIAVQIDHVKGGGYKHRKEANSLYYPQILQQVKAGSKDYRLLCANCNFIQGVLLGYRKTIWN